jgi:glycosyltransferase involved in cell wall biosynthesis
VQPVVSIITPTYNHERFIADCILSVQEQTYDRWEMIIVDDGSNDDTVLVARHFAETDDRIRVFAQENVGIFRLHETYNFALRHCSGEWVAVLEGDDLWEPRKLELQIEALRSNPDAVLSWGDVRFVSSDLKPIASSPSTEGNRDHDRTLFNNRPVGSLLNVLYMENVIPATTLTVRRNILESIGGFQQWDALPLVDLPTILALAVMGPFAYVADSLAMWRWHADQATRAYRVQIDQKVRDLVLHHLATLPEAIRGRVGITPRQIERTYRSRIHDSYVRSGREMLSERRFADARRAYVKALFFPGLPELRLRLVALAGIVSSLTRTDMEWLAQLLGKKPVA